MHVPVIPMRINGVIILIPAIIMVISAVPIKMATILPIIAAVPDHHADHGPEEINLVDHGKRKMMPLITTLWWSVLMLNILGLKNSMKKIGEIVEFLL